MNDDKIIEMALSYFLSNLDDFIDAYEIENYPAWSRGWPSRRLCLIAGKEVEAPTEDEVTLLLDIYRKKNECLK